MSISVIWLIFLTLSMISGIFTGNVPLLTGAALEGAQQGVTVTLSIAGSICLWSALACVMEKAGMLQGLQKLLRPFLKRLFPQASGDSETFGGICANLSANLLGLGNAATPPGIRAVKKMQQRSGSAIPTDEMCRLIVMNTASIQLLPTTVAALRAANGAVQPFDILPAVWCASVCSVSVGLLAGEGFRRLGW